MTKNDIQISKICSLEPRRKHRRNRYDRRILGKYRYRRKCIQCGGCLNISGYLYDEDKHRIVRYSIPSDRDKRTSKKVDRQRIRSHHRIIPEDGLGFLTYAIPGIVMSNRQYQDNKTLERKFYTCNGWYML